jgi:dienelactone hydrolase
MIKATNAHLLNLLVAMSAVLAICGSMAAADDAADPRQLGPYPVGVTTIALVDHSRTDPATNGPRTLLTEIWYPATDDAKNLPKNKYSDFLLRGTVPGTYEAWEEGVNGTYKSGLTVESYEKKFNNNAVRDARIREGRYPLIVFSHGNGGARFGYSFWTDYMASHGYIVAAPDHTGNARLTFVDGKVIKFDSNQRGYAGENRPKDISFLIDEMTRFANGADGRFAGRIDLDRIGAAGMSFGGFTTIHVINTDARIKAALALAPVWRERTNYETPFMMMIGTEDKTIGVRGNDNNRKYYEESKGPRYLVEILNGGHFTFTDVFQLNPNFGDGIGTGERITKPGEPVTFLSMEKSYDITNSYSVAFFGLHLKQIGAYSEFLSKNHFPEEIIYKAGHAE